MNSIAPLVMPHQSSADVAAIEPSLWIERHAEAPTRLHCNETPFDLPLALKQQITAKMAELSWNRYPDFHNTQLTALIAQHVQVEAAQVLLGNGSSVLIQQLFGCCAKFLSKAIIESPTFGLYHQVCQQVEMPYDQWQLDLTGNYDVSTFPSPTEPALVVLTSPNNPLGTALPLSTLENLLIQHPHCIFVLDEAYAEFGPETAVPLVAKYANLLVLKTLSKGFSLPSARFGYLVGNEALVKEIKKYSIPFCINGFTEVLVTEVLTNPAIANALKANRERVQNLRDFVYEQLKDLQANEVFSVTASSSNFLLLRFHDEAAFEQVKATLAAYQILVSYPLPNCLRLTIGTEVEMSRLLRLLRQNLPTKASF